jgi:hypothetical protein
MTALKRICPLPGRFARDRRGGPAVDSCHELVTSPPRRIRDSSG